MNTGLREDIEKQSSFQFVRSSGPGGQNVNKLNTKVVAKLNLNNLNTLNDEQKERVSKKIGNRINNENLIVIHVQDTRNREKNRQIAINRIAELIEEALIVPKKRKPTKPGRSVKEKRLGLKKAHSAKKKLRQRVTQSGD